MKKKFLFLSLILAVLVSIPAFLTGCGVTPMAHVSFKSDSGIVYYTTGHLFSNGPSIIYYESQEDYDVDSERSFSDKYEYAVNIQFLDDTFGKETINEVECEDVRLDLREIHVYVNKSKSTYAASKKVYLNGNVLTADDVYDCEYFVAYTFKNVDFIRANTTGQDNNEINYIEYK